MKRLASILAACLGIAALAGPRELSDKMLANCPEPIFSDRSGDLFIHQRQLPPTGGYDLRIIASSLKTEGKETSNYLDFNIKDKDTCVSIHDRDSNGLSSRDTLYLTHRFNGGKILALDLEYLGNNDYSVYVQLFDDLGALSSLSASTPELNPITKLLVDRKSKPFLDLGKQLYTNLIEAAEISGEVQLPYEDLKKALQRVEPALTNDLNNSDRLGKTLLELCSEYTKIAKQRLKEAEKQGVKK